MTDSPGSSIESTAADRERPTVNLVLAWTGIIAGAVFIVAVVFFSGFFIGRSTDDFDGNRGYHQGPGMMMPGMMGPGMMGPQAPGSPGQMGPQGPGQPHAPTTTPRP